MSKKNNLFEYDEATKLKLEIFGNCFEEWLPVFLYNDYIEEIFIFDFFAGSGKDINGNYGSPLILLELSKGTDKKYCKHIIKRVNFLFNDRDPEKSKYLYRNINEFIQLCKIDNGCQTCNLKFEIGNFDFQEIFSNNKIKSILKNKNVAKFVLLDQYGFKQIDSRIFMQLISYPKTDFIFFISSSFVKRFRDYQNTFDPEKLKIEKANPKDIHRFVANYFRNLIPLTQEYYLHHFSIQKEHCKGNYYGLIFGSHHSLGMEKFLKVCWEFDPLSGEANYNIDNNEEPGTLFYDEGKKIKVENIKDKMRKMLLNGEINDNISGLKYALQNNCLPIIFIDVLRELEKKKLIKRVGKDINYAATKIHKIKKYEIVRIKK